MNVEHVAASTPADQVAATLSRDGVVVVDRLVAPDVMDRARAELEPYLRRDRGRAGRVLRPAHAAHRRADRALADLPRAGHAPARARHACAACSAHATSFQLHLTQVIAIGPGEPAQLIHRDQWAFDFFPFPAGYEVQCNTIWAMTDFTEENGATRVIPGSNSSTTGCSSPRRDTVPAEMPKGSVLFYTGSLYHGGGANRSERRALRHQHHLQPRVAAPGGEPVPLGAARDRAHAARSTCCG